MLLLEVFLVLLEAVLLLLGCGIARGLNPPSIDSHSLLTWLDIVLC